MQTRTFSKWLSPDLMRVSKRFPFALIFALICTIIVLVSANELVFLPEESALRLFSGGATGFVLAVAGQLFMESRPELRRSGLLLAYVLPLVGALLFLVEGADWLVLPVLPFAAIMWLSVSAFTRAEQGHARSYAQDRFWWLNQGAIVSGGIAVGASIIFMLGLLAIDRSLDLLFGIEIWDVFTRWVLPVVLFICVPVYWLAVLPNLGDFDQAMLERPDFLTRAVGFVGLYVVSPLIGVYALILAAYALQIIVTRTLPVGVLGWLVTTYLVAGAANWLILYPHFLRNTRVARLYRSLWFGATLLPLALLAVGLYVRIEAYGLTSERLMLVAAGAWAFLLALIHLLPGRMGDIRLVPGLAGIVLLVLGLGPLNVLALPAESQADRLDRALSAAEATGGPGWTQQNAEVARSAIDYLVDEDHGRARLISVLSRHGYASEVDGRTSWEIAETLGLPALQSAGTSSEWSLQRRAFSAVTVAETPYLLGEVWAYQNSPSLFAGIGLSIADNELVLTDGEEEDVGRFDLGVWAAAQGESEISQPGIDLTLSGRQFRVVVQTASLTRKSDEAPAEVTFLSGQIFSDRPE